MGFALSFVFGLGFGLGCVWLWAERFFCHNYVEIAGCGCESTLGALEKWVFYDAFV